MQSWSPGRPPVSKDGHGDGSGKPLTVIDWPARHAELVAADGDEWDRLSAAYVSDWADAYCRAFVAFAVSRGWSQDEAESWPSHIVQDAMLEAAKWDWSPQAAAEADVIECEQEAE